MSSYTITNKKLNKNKVFILLKSELEKRFDPIYYAHEFNEYEKLINKKPYKKFNQILHSINNGFDFRDYKDNGTPYLKVANIKKGEFDFSKIQYIDFDSTDISKNIQLKKGNILLTRKGTFGNAIALEQDYNYVISSEVFYIELKDNSINPKFLEIFFNSKIGQAQFDKNKIGAIMGSLSQEAIRDLKIPIPSADVQNDIVNIFNIYNEKKVNNLSKSKDLLNSIDDYLLNQLGIVLPEKQDNTLKNRMFTTSLNDISGNRFDPNFNKVYYKEVQKSFENSDVNFTNIKSTLEYIKTGTTPHQKLNPFTENKEIVFLRNTNLKKYQIDLKNTKYVKSEFGKELTYSLKGEVIMCIAGTVGLSAVNDIEEPISINQNVSALKFYDNLINPNFASYWFNTNIFIELTKRACSVATIHYLNNDNLKLLPIPIPSIEKQNEIAEHISAIRKQIKELKDLNKELLQKANEEIENLILNT